MGIFKNEYSEATEEEFRLAEDMYKTIRIYKNDSLISNRDNRLDKLLREIKENYYIDTFENVSILQKKIKTKILEILKNGLLDFKVSDLSGFFP